MEFSVGNVDEGWNVSVQVEECVQLDGALCPAEPRPWEQRQAEVDGRGVERVDGIVDIEAGKRVIGVDVPGDVDEVLCEVGVDFPVAGLIGIGEGVAGRPRHGCPYGRDMLRSFLCCGGSKSKFASGLSGIFATFYFALHSYSFVEVPVDRHATYLGSLSTCLLLFDPLRRLAVARICDPFFYWLRRRSLPSLVCKAVAERGIAVSRYPDPGIGILPLTAT